MLYWLAEWLLQKTQYGPLRLFNSYFFLGASGFLIAGLLTWFLLPFLWHLLPTDKGRAFAVNADQSKGKPISGGSIFIPIFIVCAILFIPFNIKLLLFLLCLSFASFIGYLDDKSGGWGQLSLGLMDALVSIVTAIIICNFSDMSIWLPFSKEIFIIPYYIYIPLASALIWVVINATNCTDGVDGLSGSLTAIAFFELGVILYAVLGNTKIANYLLVPYQSNGPQWGLAAIIMVGSLFGYLWHNANPSKVMMGDAGSRALGLFLGTLAVITANPFFIFLVSTVILVNGGTGLVKLALLKTVKIGILKSIRFPLHDHFRKNRGWSNTQVLIRFILIQFVITQILILIFFKVR